MTMDLQQERVEKVVASQDLHHLLLLVVLASAMPKT